MAEVVVPVLAVPVACALRARAHGDAVHEHELTTFGVSRSGVIHAVFHRLFVSYMYPLLGRVV
eukprot:3940392-Rhodomonas_salina.5